MDNQLICCVSIITAAAALLLNNSNRNWWVRPWLERRHSRGTLSLVHSEFDACGDTNSHMKFLRMSKKTFYILLQMIEKDIAKQNTHLRNTISAQDRLIVTLRYLATGESFVSLQCSMRISQASITKIVPEVCQVIYNNLKSTYMKTPNTAAEWLRVSQEFEEKWNLPNTLAAMDGKHICFRAPRTAGSIYYNYKQQHSIVLLALADANYNFLYIDVGTNGRVSDGSVFRKSTLQKAIVKNKLNFPEEKPLPLRTRNVPHVIVADAAFPLMYNILKPFPLRNMTTEQRIFIYRVSRARRVVENAFGILANKWRCLLSIIHMSADKVRTITLACCVLHNFVKAHDGMPISDVEQKYTIKYGLSQQFGNRASAEALDTRKEFCAFVNNEGAVAWQNNLA